jgi:hypothetical protein
MACYGDNFSVLYGIVFLFDVLFTSALVNGQLQVSVALPTEKAPLGPSDRRLYGPQSPFLNFFNFPDICSLTVALGSTQALTEMSTKNHFVRKTQPARKAEILTAICEPIFLLENM